MHYIFIILTAISFFSCFSQDTFLNDRLKTTEKFLEWLKRNQPDKIIDYTESSVYTIIDDKEARDFYVNKAFKFISKYGLPSKEKWLVNQDPANNFERLTITIPIFSGYDSTYNLEKADIIFVFPPPQISSKIVRFEIVDKYKMRSTKSLPGLTVDSAQQRE